MSLSWNEIRKRSIEFSNEWKDESRENAEAKSFWDGFFNIFGIKRRRIASFEEPVKILGSKKGFIDLFWKGTLIIEHKSRGKNLDTAYSQSLDYFPGLSEDELPKYVLVSDFDRFRLYDLEENTNKEFHITDLYNNIHLFSFIAGYTKKSYRDEAPVNIRAAELMGKLHDALKDNGFLGHPLEVFLVRIMFCLFAEDTGIFDKGIFTHFIEDISREDGIDLGNYISIIFQVLNTPECCRQKNLDEELSELPYIDGRLFEEPLPTPCFNSDTRKVLLKCCYYDWSKVSPAIFGSMFQSVMDRDKRSDIGAFYTSEKNILKTIKPLFLDDLIREFHSHINDRKYLQNMIAKINSMSFLDPACGCGNFLIITYRELRLLQHKLYTQIYKLSGKGVQISWDIKQAYNCIDVDSMYGIEKEEFPARIAQVALWLVDHQMNMELSHELGERFVRFPLSKAPHIIVGDALIMQWDKVIPSKKLSYILGNPPFVAKNNRDSEQNYGMSKACISIKEYTSLDYVCAWYIKAAEYIQNTTIKVAFVSTNSISQGEQTGVLWKYLFSKNIKIHFAHRTFKWDNGSKGDAQVFVIIIGFANYDTRPKYIYDYTAPDSEAMQIKASNINPYLVDHDNFLITNRNSPISSVPPIVFGSMPNDGGHLLLSDNEKNALLQKEPKANKFIRPFISAREFLHNEKRWCLWLVDAMPSDIKSIPEILKRVEKVKEYRLRSSRKETVELAECPSLFGEIRQPNGDYIIIPRHSSEKRNYIPISIKSRDYIAGDSCCIIPGAALYHFGVLSSCMHMAWVRLVCGRLEGRYRYSNKLVYNNFPWPDNPSEDKIKKVEDSVSILIKIRNVYSYESLADLYDPKLMPLKLRDIHKKIDKAVDMCYRKQPFESELDRLNLLFELYRRYLNM